MLRTTKRGIQRYSTRLSWVLVLAVCVIIVTGVLPIQCSAATELENHDATQSTRTAATVYGRQAISSVLADKTVELRRRLFIYLKPCRPWVRSEFA
jgi:hypothetical protein